MPDLLAQLLERLPRDPKLRSFFLYLEEDTKRASFTFVLEGERRVVSGEVGPAAFGIFVDAQDLRDLVEGFGDARAMHLDGRLRFEGDLGAGLVLLGALANLKA